METVVILIVLILIVIFYDMYLDIYGSYGKNNLIAYKGDDGIIYDIHAAHVRTEADKKKALSALMRIQERNIALLSYLKINFPEDIRTRRMLANYNPDVIMENSPLNGAGDTAYVIGKGNEFRMCLRSKRGRNKIHSDDILTFVHLHELAHIASVSYDHGQEFWTNFKWLLFRASEAGVYYPVNYELYPFEYCGMPVDYNPYYDPSKGDGNTPLY